MKRNLKRTSEKNNLNGNYSKIIYVRISSKLKTNKSLKLLLVDMKANSSKLMRLEMAWMAQNIPYFLYGPSRQSRRSN